MDSVDGTIGTAVVRVIHSHTVCYNISDCGIYERAWLVLAAVWLRWNAHALRFYTGASQREETPLKQQFMRAERQFGLSIAVVGERLEGIERDRATRNLERKRERLPRFRPHTAKCSHKITHSSFIV